MSSKELQDKITDIIALKDEGKTYKQIAELYNSSASTIGRLLRENNEWSRSKISESDIVEMIKSYTEDKKSLKGIARSYHISPSALSELFKERNVHINSISEAKRKYAIDETYFDSIDTPNKAYFLGLLYADGNYCPKKKNVSISLQENDKHILESFNAELKSNRPLRKIDYHSKNEKWNDQYILDISNAHIAQKLASHGVIPNKSLLLTFPEWLETNLISHFIRGYFDGDGCILKNPKEKRATLISTEQFCLKVKNIIHENLNINCSINYCHNNIDSSTRELRISGGKQVKKFLDFIYSDSQVHLYRKFDLYKTIYC